jgi:hypothetical protein
MNAVIDKQPDNQCSGDRIAEKFIAYTMPGLNSRYYRQFVDSGFCN